MLRNRETRTREGGPLSMTRSPILTVVTRWAAPTMLIFAVWLLWKGHNEPGGGFIGGLLTAAAVLLQLMASGREDMGLTSERTARLSAVGPGIGVTSATLPVLLGQPFFQQTFDHFHLPVIGDLELATALFFDIGVFIVVIGTITTVILALAERD